MLTTLTLALTLSLPADLSVVELNPTDDVWAYPHASEPDKDPLLRVWGFEGMSVGRDAGESESLGYSFLRFDAVGLPEKPLKSATLTLYHSPKPSFTLDMAKANPLEARPVASGFTEKTWSYGDLSKFMPAAGKDAVFGSASPDSVSEDKAFPIRIDLLKGPGGFSKALEAARSAKSFAIALTSTLSPSDEMRATYRLYSKDGPKDSRPVLRLEFED
jgi:hypothetical protein